VYHINSLSVRLTEASLEKLQGLAATDLRYD